jgi:hypothetical protein
MNESDVKIYIRKNDTGEIRQYADTLSCEDGNINTFIWSDGNYSCDCNRELFFCRANNDLEPDKPKCSDSRYSVKIVSNGEVLYSEYE